MTSYQQQIKDLKLSEPLSDPIPEMIQVHKGFLELIDSCEDDKQLSELHELAQITEQEILDLINLLYYEKKRNEEQQEMDDFFSSIHEILLSHQSDDEKIEQIIEIPSENERILHNLFEAGKTNKLTEKYLKIRGLKIGPFSLVINVGNFRLVRSSWLNQFRLEKIKRGTKT